jgi:hypothetical protein
MAAFSASSPTLEVEQRRRQSVVSEVRGGELPQAQVRHVEAARLSVVSAVIK